MAIKKNSGRQEIVVAVTPFTFGTGADVEAQGVFPAVELPQNAIIMGGYLTVSDATTTGVTVSVGTTGSPTSLLAATAADSVGTANLTLTHASIGPATTFNVTVAGATPVAPGAAELVITYIVKGRAEFSQG
jgi:hypothetical protein